MHPCLFYLMIILGSGMMLLFLNRANFDSDQVILGLFPG